MRGGLINDRTFPAPKAPHRQKLLDAALGPVDETLSFRSWRICLPNFRVLSVLLCETDIGIGKPLSNFWTYLNISSCENHSLDLHHPPALP